MFTIQIVASCPVEYGEIGVRSLDQATCDIEESVGLLLQKLFDVVLVEKVIIQYSPTEEERGDLQSDAA